MAVQAAEVILRSCEEVGALRKARRGQTSALAARDLQIMLTTMHLLALSRTRSQILSTYMKYISPMESLPLVVQISAQVEFTEPFQ
jgi:hypothetical protein